MGRRVLAIGILLIGVLTASAAWAVLPAALDSSIMCPPLTMDDLLEDETTTTTSPTTTSPTTTSSTTTSSTTTTATTTPSTTTSSTTTSAPPDTTTPDTSTPDTTAPDTTAPETTAPETTAPDTTSSTAPTTTSTTVEKPAKTTTTVPPTTTTTTTLPPCDEEFVYPLVFPILGAGGIGSPFGAPRDGGRRLHAGNDLFAPHLQPVIAAAAGVVSRIGGDEGISGNRVYIRHTDGWSTLYIHLNNDTAGTDDGNGRGVRFDLEEGDAVAAGQVIGWIGDSGNAEGTVHHLHFELRDPEGDPVDPEASLRAAEVMAIEDMDLEFSGPFADRPWGDDGVDPMQLLLSRGAPVWCDDNGALACPDEPAEAASVAAWLTPLIGHVSLDPAPVDGPAALDCSDARSCLEGVEVGGDCAEECASTTVTRAELMRAFAWDRLRDAHKSRGFLLTQSVPDTPWATPVPAPPQHPHDLPIREVMAMFGPTACHSPDEIDKPLTRAEAAGWIVDYLGWAGNDACRTVVSATASATR